MFHFLLTISCTVLVRDGLLVPCSLPGSPAVKQFTQMLTVVAGQGGQPQSVFLLPGLAFALFRGLLWLLAGELTIESGNRDSDEALLEVMGSKQIWHRVYMWSQQDLMLCCMWASQMVLALKNPPDTARKHKSCGFDPWIRKIPGRTRQPTPIFLPGESHGQRSQVGGLQSKRSQQSDVTEVI